MIWWFERQNRSRTDEIMVIFDFQANPHTFFRARACARYFPGIPGLNPGKREMEGAGNSREFPGREFPGRNATPSSQDMRSISMISFLGHPRFTGLSI